MSGHRCVPLSQEVWTGLVGEAQPASSGQAGRVWSAWVKGSEDRRAKTRGVGGGGEGMSWLCSQKFGVGYKADFGRWGRLSRWGREGARREGRKRESSRSRTR